MQGMGKGWPDLTLVRERMVVMEFKVPPRKLTVEQGDWLDALERAGIETHVIRPEQWLDGTVDFILAVRAA